MPTRNDLGVVLLVFLPWLGAETVVAQQPVVFDFEQFRFENASVNYVAHEVVQDNFRIRHGENESTPFAVYGTLSDRFAGSVALQSGTVNGLIRVEETGGRLFDLHSIEIAMLNSPGTVRVELTGYIAGGGIVMQTIVHHDDDFPLNLGRYEVDGFTNLRKVEWRQAVPYHQFDNVTVSLSTGYRMTGQGPCPGSFTLHWYGAEPNGMQGLVFGRQRGEFVIPNGLPCAGTVMGVSGGVRLVSPPGYFSTGSNGEGSITGRVGTAACGGVVQLLQGGDCSVTNVVGVE